MGVFDTVKRWFSNEAAEAREVLDGTRGRINSDLDRREAELAASPSEKLDMIQESIDEDNSFDALRDKIEGRTATADATTDVADLDRPATDTAPDQAEAEAGQPAEDPES